MTPDAIAPDGARAFDDVVVGAGSAGIVMATRFSEDPSRQVLLVEAGPDFAGETDADHLSRPVTFAQSTSRDWGLKASIGGGREVDYPQGKTAGGGSAVNGALAIRGAPADFDGWAARGNDEWAWERMLGCFRRLEADADFHDAVHGTDGPIPIVRWGRDELVPLQEAFLDGAQRCGFAWTDDHNAPDATGIGPFPMNRRGDLRVSTAIGYLEAARSRPNLTIRSATRAARVVIEGGRATGVELERDGRLETVHADRVVLSAGSIQSPALLARSGIGPARDLGALGIPVVVDNPHVGANLMEHPGSFLFLVPEDGACDPTGPQYQLGLRYTGPGSETFNDMLIGMLNFMDLSVLPELGSALGVPVVVTLTCGVHQPRARGRVTLTSTDHRVDPAVDFNLLGHPDDARRLCEALRTCREIASTPGLAACTRGFGLVDDATFAADDALSAYVHAVVAPWYHASGTCAMGPGPAEGAVVDQHLRVHGVEGLRVVDASVMPVITRAPTNLTTIAVAERAVELDRAGR